MRKIEVEVGMIDFEKDVIYSSDCYVNPLRSRIREIDVEAIDSMSCSFRGSDNFEVFIESAFSSKFIKGNLNINDMVRSKININCDEKQLENYKPEGMGIFKDGVDFKIHFDHQRTCLAYEVFADDVTLNDFTVLSKNEAISPDFFSIQFDLSSDHILCDISTQGQQAEMVEILLLFSVGLTNYKLKMNCFNVGHRMSSKRGMISDYKLFEIFELTKI